MASEAQEDTADLADGMCMQIGKDKRVRPAFWRIFLPHPRKIAEL